MECTFFPITKIENHEFKLVELKEIAKKYKLKQSGKKAVLEERLINFMRESVATFVIQRGWRKWMMRRYVQAKGPARKDPSVCVNDSDFFTLDTLSEVPEYQFFSYRDDKTGQIYGFDIKSLYQLFFKGGLKATNPYTRQAFPSFVYQNMRTILRYAPFCYEPVDVELNADECLSEEKRQEMRLLALFQKMDELGNYTDQRWFSSLGRIGLIKFIRELADIWSFRAQLTKEVKRKICPPIGDPFNSINLLTLPSLTIFDLKNRAMNAMERLIVRGIDEPHRSLGVNYILCALTLVNDNAAESLPWLYQSVA